MISTLGFKAIMEPLTRVLQGFLLFIPTATPTNLLLASMSANPIPYILFKQWLETAVFQVQALLVVLSKAFTHSATETGFFCAKRGLI